jgi:cyclic dehypoxanthinyl futalosine synthase
MNADLLLKQALQSDFLTAEEGLFLFKNVPTAELVDAGHRMRKKLHPQNVVTWIIEIGRAHV